MFDRRERTDHDGASLVELDAAGALSLRLPLRPVPSATKYVFCLWRVWEVRRQALVNEGRGGGGGGSGMLFGRHCDAYLSACQENVRSTFFASGPCYESRPVPFLPSIRHRSRSRTTETMSATASTSRAPASGSSDPPSLTSQDRLLNVSQLRRRVTHIQADVPILLRLPSGKLKQVTLQPGRSVGLGKFGSFKADDVIGQPFGFTYEINEDGSLGIVLNKTLAELGESGA